MVSVPAMITSWNVFAQCVSNHNLPQPYNLDLLHFVWVPDATSAHNIKVLQVLELTLPQCIDTVA